MIHSALNIGKLSFILILLTSLYSCSSSESNESTEQSEEITETNEMEEISIDAILSKIEKANFPQQWDYDFLESKKPFKPVYISMDEFDQLNLLKDAYSEDSVGILWRHTTADWNMVCIETHYMNPKGMSYEYFLVTLGEMNNKSDELLLAASWAISVPNPYGGSSAGQNFQYATISDNGLSITTENDGKTKKYEVSLDGKFVEVEEEQAVIELNYPIYTEATLTSIDNHIDVITFTFDENGKELSFNYQTSDLTEEGNPYFYFGDPGDGVIAPIVVKEGMKTNYKIRYEYQYFENAAAEMDTMQVLTGLTTPSGSFERRLRTLTGNMLGYDDNGDYFLISVKEAGTGVIFDLVVREPDWQYDITENLGLNDLIEVSWMWIELDNPGEGRDTPFKVFQQYHKKS